MARCSGCQALVINGILCHEAGCPDAWRDEVRECRECGTGFVPDDRGQRDCCEDCRAAYLGLDDVGADWARDYDL